MNAFYQIMQLRKLRRELTEKCAELDRAIQGAKRIAQLAEGIVKAAKIQQYQQDNPHPRSSRSGLDKSPYRQ